MSLSLLLPFLPAFPHIHQRLEPVVFPSDPLHVLGPVDPASAQGRDVVNVVSRTGPARAAGGGAGVLSAEGSYLGAVAIDLSVG